MFLILLMLVVVGFAADALRRGSRSRREVAELGLRWILAGYCGLPMVVVSVGVLAAPDRAADVLGFAPGHPFQAFMGWAYLGLSLSATLALRYRGVYLVGPAVAWAVFFAGATAIHLRLLHDDAALTHGGLLVIFLVHGFISVLLVAGLLASGLLTGGGRPAAGERAVVRPSGDR